MIIKKYYRTGVDFWIAAILYTGIICVYVFGWILMLNERFSINGPTVFDFIIMSICGIIILDMMRIFLGCFNSAVRLTDKKIFCKDDWAPFNKKQHAVSANYEDILAVLFTTSMLSSNDKPRHLRPITAEIPFIMIVEKSGITKKISPFSMSFKQVKAMLLALKNNCEIIGNPIKIDVDSIMSSYKNYYKKIF